jgi:hypothetical protein
MKDAKRKKLKAAGWSTGSADEFLELSEDESRQVAESMPPAPVPRADGLRIPDGWTLEALERQPDYALLSTPSPKRYMATIDFRARGIRSGYSVSGKFVGEEWNKRRTKPSGRGWKQELVDSAIAHLQEVLR